MKYTKEERLDIAKRVVEHESTYSTASEQYSVIMPTIYLWIKEYKKMNNLVIDGRNRWEECTLMLNSQVQAQFQHTLR